MAACRDSSGVACSRLRAWGVAGEARGGLGAANRLVLGLLLVGGCLWTGWGAGRVTTSSGRIQLPTYPWWPALKHPYFRGTDGRNIYPYPMLDQLSRKSELRSYATVVLENEYLRVVFVPELGGKVYEVVDKVDGRQMFYVNRVVKPGLIGQCGAWISGGIEWNTGPQGHTVSCLQPVDVLVLPPAADGSRSVAIGETERIYGTKWTVQVTLRPGRSYLEETIRIYNAASLVRPYYFWNCTAVPNTPGFQFVYPMTLGTDHAGTTFYTWPLANGKDLSRGTNYQDASSIFAYGCDQDFFGSYDHQAGRGVVACANHHQLPGKKAWTWGHGSYGTMHQMDLTDQDGPYNEVQTGPLLTQAEVGRLDPQEAVSWQEWWYPVRGLGGFCYATRDLAVNVEPDGAKLRLRLQGTGTWQPASVRVRAPGSESPLFSGSCTIAPRAVAELEFPVGAARPPFEIEVGAPGGPTLARFRYPADLPVRQPPGTKPAPQTASELAQAGWQDYLFARFSEAEAQLKKALEKDARCADAQAGLAFLNLDRDPAAAAAAAEAATVANPDLGLGWQALSVARYRLGQEAGALEAAWKAALDPALAVPARAMVAKLHLRQQRWQGAIEALREPGPWQADPVCRNRLALACLAVGERAAASHHARENLATDPLDLLARYVVHRAGGGGAASEREFLDLLTGRPQPAFELTLELADLGLRDEALEVSDLAQAKRSGAAGADSLGLYLRAWLLARTSSAGRSPLPGAAAQCLAKASELPADGIFPHQVELLPVLEWAIEQEPRDGNAALYAGHLLFSLGRHAQGRALWKKAAELGAGGAVPGRALGMAALSLDGDPAAAAGHLEAAHRLDPADPIVARDLARVLFTLADKADGEAKKERVMHARDILKAAFAGGQGRADFVALLARAHSRLGEFGETARLLDAVRITIWEGAREAHDLFEEAHLVLGKGYLEGGRAAEALAEFNRSLEYPPNLATGKLENTREAHIHYLRGQALAALGRKEAAIQAWKQAVAEPASAEARQREARQKAQEALDRAQP